MTGSATLAAPRREACRDCAHFANDPAAIEAALTGIASLGSVHASVRADDGLCARHDRLRAARAWCVDFLPRTV